MENLWLYAALVFGIIVLPGMDMAFVLASSLASGRRAGFAAVAGTVAGGFVHAVMSAFGVGLLLKLFPSVFNFMLLAGSLYVVWMGYSIWNSAAALSDIRAENKRSLMQTFMRAVMTCLLNPKAYIFMFAVFPQFLKPDAALPLWSQAIVLFAIGAICQITIYGAVALAAAHVRDWLQTSASTQITFGRVVGALLMVAACWTLWSGWR
jgi:threonine/homoserine/homoserine lactone efflux protein